MVFSNFGILIVDFGAFLTVSSTIWYKMSSLYPTLEDMKVDQVVQVSTIGTWHSLYIFIEVLLSSYLTVLNQTTGIWQGEASIVNQLQKVKVDYLLNFFISQFLIYEEVAAEVIEN